VKALLRLYPAAWRRRYGAEFGEVVARSSQGRWKVGIDVLRGAADAWWQRGNDPDFRLQTRLAGLLFLVAGTCWSLGISARTGAGQTVASLSSRGLLGSDTMRGYVPLLLLFGILGLWRFGYQSSRLPRFAPVLLAVMVAGLGTYCGAWATERFLGFNWYSVALLRGFGVVGIGIFLAALIAAGLLLLRARLLPAWSLVPLIAGTLAILLFLLGAATGAIGREQIYLHQDHLALLFGLLWLPLGYALLTVKSAPRYGNASRSIRFR